MSDCPAAFWLPLLALSLVWWGGCREAVVTERPAAIRGFVGDADVQQQQADVQEQHPADAGATEGEDGVGVAEPAPGPPVAPETATAFGLPLIKVQVDPRELERMLDDAGMDIELSTRVIVEGNIYQAVTLQLHGGHARSLPKKSFRLTFEDDHKFETDWFTDGGSGEEHRRLVLQASWVDPTWMRNKLTMDAILELGGLAPRTSFAMLSINEGAPGLYQVIERVDRLYLEANDLDKEGNVYKAVSHAADWGTRWDPMAGFEQKVNEENPSEDLAFLREACADTPVTFADFESRVASILDLQGFMTWILVQTYAMNRDTFTKNYYLHHSLQAPPGTAQDRFRVISWDADATWGQNWNGNAVRPDSADHVGTDELSPRLLGIPEYLAAYKASYREVLDGRLHASVLRARAAAIHERIQEAARADLASWQPALDFEAEYARLREAIETRHRVMSAAIDGL